MNHSRTPLVTVGIPAYNHEKYIGYTLESVLNQTFQDFEIIVVDDCSRDRTAAIAESFGDPRIRVICHPANRGPSAAANTYMAAARGRWISSTPSDDAYLPTRLEEQLLYLEKNPACEMVMTRVQFIDEANNSLPEKNHFAAGLFDYTTRTRHEWLRYFFDEGNCIPAAAMWSRRFYDEGLRFDTRMLLLQDYDYWTALAVRGAEFGIVDKPLTAYRIREGEGNLSNTSLPNFRRFQYERAYVLERFLEMLDPAEYTAAFGGNTPELGFEQKKIWVAHQLALRAWKKRSPAHREFALRIWHELFGEEKYVPWLAEWGMPTKQFFAATAENPLMNNPWSNTQYSAYSFLNNYLPDGIKTKLRGALKRWRFGN